MKKAFVIFYRLLLISVTLQALAFFAVNNLYLGNRNDIEGKMKVIPVAALVENLADTGVKIPEGARDLKVSFDGAYAAYIDEDKLVVVDTVTRKTVKDIESVFPEIEGQEKNGEKAARIDCYKWYSDRNTLMYVLSAPDNLPGRIQILTFDATNEALQIGASFAGGNLKKGSKVLDVVFSPLNMMTHIKVRISETQTQIYRVNIMDDISSPFTLGADTLMVPGYYTDTLVYQNGKGQIFVKSGTNAGKQLSFKKKAVLLDVTGDSTSGKDILYAGELNEEGKVADVLHGAVGTDPSKWSRISLKKPVDPKDILIKGTGKLYTVSADDRTVTAIPGDKGIKFSGSFVDLTEDQVIYVEDGMLKSKSF